MLSATPLPVTSIDMTTVYASRHDWEIHLARHTLERAGIPAFVADENTANVNPSRVFALGGIKLKVAEKDAAKAREILMEMQGQPTAADNRADCPRCADVKAKRTKWYGLINVACLLLLGIPLLFIRKTVCAECGKTHLVC